jgi:hypothetical protein
LKYPKLPGKIEGVWTNYHSTQKPPVSRRFHDWSDWSDQEEIVPEIKDLPTRMTDSISQYDLSENVTTSSMPELNNEPNPNVQNRG